MSKKEQLAHYINAYNAICIQQILDDYDKIKNSTQGPLTIKGFFDQKKYKLSGKLISLNELENKIIRPIFKEPKIHFALVCGAKGCPVLINRVYKAKTLESTLTKNTTRYLSSMSGLKLDRTNKKIFLSQIFDWFKTDFGNSNKKGDYNGIRKFISQYRPDIKKEIQSYAIEFMPYNWNLNKQ